MKLTVEDLTKIIREVVKELDENGLTAKGVAGYPIDEDDPTEPLGFAKAEAHDFSHTSAEGNRYKKQGAANFGPYTSENAVRALAQEAIKEHFSANPVPKKRLESSAPFTQARAKVGNPGSVGNVTMPEWKSSRGNASIWEELGHWYSPGGVQEKKKSAKQKKFESNILQNVYSGRVSEGKIISEKEVGFKKLAKSLPQHGLITESTTNSGKNRK